MLITLVTPETRRGLLTVSGLLALLEHESEDLTWADGYADGSECRRGVLIANWNTENLLRRSTRADRDLQAAHARVNKLQRYLYGGHLTDCAGRPTPKAPSMFPTLTREALRRASEDEREILQPWADKALRIGDILERAGYSLEWSDMGCCCGGCNRWISTVATDFCFTPDYLLTEGNILCGGCVREEIKSHLDDLLDQVVVPVALEDCHFARNLDLDKTWAAIEALDDEDLSVCLADQQLLDALRDHPWPAIHHDNQVVFRVPDSEVPVALVIEAILGDGL